MSLFTRSVEKTPKGSDPGTQAQSDRRPAIPPDQWAFLVGFLVLLPFFLAPLVVTRFLPGQLFPHHVALADVLARSGSPSAYQPIYHAELRVVPDVAYYALMAFLAQSMTLTLAHKVLVGLSIAGLPLGAARLLGATQRSRIPALLCFPLGYGVAFLHGLAPFMLSLPVLFFLLGQVCDNLDDDHDFDENVGQAFLRDALLAGLALLLCFSSLETYLFGLLAAGIMLLFASAPMVYRVRAAICFLPSLVALGWWRAVTVHDEQPAAVGRALHLVVQGRSRELVGQSLGQDMLTRLGALPQHLLPPFSDSILGPASAIGLGLLGALGCYIVLGTLAIFVRTTRRELAQMVRPGIAVLVLAAAAYTLLPEQPPQLDTPYLASRFAPVGAVLLVLLVPAWLKRLPRWALLLALIPALASCGWVGAELIRLFGRYGTEIADFGKLLDRTPAGATVMGLVFEPESKTLGDKTALAGLPYYYVAERGGKDSLVAQPLCGARHGLCEVFDSGRTPPDASALGPGRVNMGRAIFHAEYFLTQAPPPLPRLFGRHAQYVEEVAREGPWVLFHRKSMPPPETADAGPAGATAPTETAQPATAAPAPTGKRPATPRSKRRGHR